MYTSCNLLFIVCVVDPAIKLELCIVRNQFYQQTGNNAITRTILTRRNPVATSRAANNSALLRRRISGGLDLIQLSVNLDPRHHEEIVASAVVARLQNTEETENLRRLHLPRVCSPPAIQRSIVRVSSQQRPEISIHRTL